jgi:hypothetical protein
MAVDKAALVAAHHSTKDGTHHTVIPAKAGTHHVVIPARAGIHHAVIPAKAGTHFDFAPTSPVKTACLAGPRPPIAAAVA